MRLMKLSTVNLLEDAKVYLLLVQAARVHLPLSLVGALRGPVLGLQSGRWGYFHDLRLDVLVGEVNVPRRIRHVGRRPCGPRTSFEVLQLLSQLIDHAISCIINLMYRRRRKHRPDGYPRG